MLRFAPRYGIISPALVRPSRMAPRHAANDTDGTPDPVLTDARVEAALRLFAEHGFGAPECARQAAANANARGDTHDARWWTEVGAVFARRR
jgi:hypothetical protein